MHGYATFRSRHHQVFDAHVGERAARHDEIVAAPRAVAVEVLRLDPARHQVLTGRRSWFDRARRRNVIGRHGVAEDAERPRAANVGDVPGFHREILEERRLMNVVALLVPLINFADARRDFVPLRILIGEVAIESAENFRRERGLHRVANFAERRPEIAQKSFLSGFVFADRLVR